jgi:hypothetical protein
VRYSRKEGCHEGPLRSEKDVISNVNHKEREKEMTKTRDLRALLAVLVAMLLALIAGVVLVRLAGAEVPEHHPPIYVSGKDQGVTATGIYLNDGDRVDFSANGKFGPGCVFCSGEISPNGDPNTTTDATFLAPGKPAYSLLGKVPGSDYFEIGSNETWTYGGVSPPSSFWRSTIA